MGASAVIQQHLIDPEICIRCNTCEAICPVKAITHDSANYVVDAEICNSCMACISPCPTGSIDNWRAVPKARAYSLQEQFGWEVLPAHLPVEVPAELSIESVGDTPNAQAAETSSVTVTAGAGTIATGTYHGATMPPWSAAHAYTNLYGPNPRTPAAQQHIKATVTGNARVTQVGNDCDTHHIVLDFANLPFPVLEGQSIGVLPPGLDGSGKPHHPRQYSVASPRNGERPGYNNLSLTVKRVLEDHQGKAVRGVASNHLCDLNVGDTVQVIGPFGASFLMPNHPKSHIVMICTGTGSAPMRAMTEWRRRLVSKTSAKNLQDRGRFESGKLLLFFGARSQEELPYFGPLQNLPKDFIETHFAFSRTPGQPKKYVQDALREQAALVAQMLADGNSYFYVCGLKSMEEGVLLALRDIAEGAGLHWADLADTLQRHGRLHLETY